MIRTKSSSLSRELDFCKVTLLDLDTSKRLSTSLIGHSKNRLVALETNKGFVVEMMKWKEQDLETRIIQGHLPILLQVPNTSHHEGKIFSKSNACCQSSQYMSKLRDYKNA